MASHLTEDDIADRVFAILEESGVPTENADDALTEWIANDMEAGITDPHVIADRAEDGIDFGEY